MEQTPFSFAAGHGKGRARFSRCAARFSRTECLQTPESLAEWERLKQKKQKRARGGDDRRLTHDTVTVLTRDQQGHLAGACSTSGLSHKLPGRVADSPLIGAGLYVDDTAGAAGGTGVGEEIIRAGGSVLIVEMLRSGKTPQEACEAMIGRVIEWARRRDVRPAEVAFLSLDPTGNVGGACTKGTDFWYAVGRAGKVELVKAPELGQKRRSGNSSSRVESRRRRSA